MISLLNIQIADISMSHHEDLNEVILRFDLHLMYFMIAILIGLIVYN